MSSSPTPTASATATPGVARWSLALLLGINLFNYIDRQVLAAVLPQIKREFQASDDEMGWLATVFLLSYMCFAPLFGRLAERYGRWLLVGVGVILWSLASGASGLATSITIMLFTRAFVGIGEAAYGPAAPTIISDLFPQERRGRVLAWFYVAIPVGSALGYLLGGQVLNFGYSWHWAFFVVVPPGLLLGVLALVMRDPPRIASAEELPKSHLLADYRKLIRIRSYLFNTAGMTAMTFALGGLAFWMPDYIVWRHEVEGLIDSNSKEAVDAATAAANSIFGPIIVLSGLLGTLAGGWVGDKLRPRWPGSYFLVSGIAMILSFPLVALLPFVPFPTAWGLIFVACVGLFFNTGPTNTILANVTHPSIRAAGFALNIFIIHALGDAISPQVIGVLNVYFGNNNVGIVAVSFTILLGGILWLLGARYLQEDTQQAAEGGSRKGAEAQR
jgi:MFS family permease